MTNKKPIISTSSTTTTLRIPAYSASPNLDVCLAYLSKVEGGISITPNLTLQCLHEKGSVALKEPYMTPCVLPGYWTLLFSLTNFPSTPARKRSATKSKTSSKNISSKRDSSPKSPSPVKKRVKRAFITTKSPSILSSPTVKKTAKSPSSSVSGSSKNLKNRKK